MKNVQIIPHLAFQGNCEEAISTYIKAFGGEVYYLSRWSKEARGATPEKIGKVMHAEFALGATRMSASDACDPLGVNTAIKLMIHMASKDEALHTMSVLGEGGTVVSPLQPHPAPDDGGCGAVVLDRFGYNWIITCPNPDKQ